MITISIVEDNEQFRSGLEAIIKGQSDFALIASFDSAEKAIPALLQSPADIVISDISLPGMRGTALIVQLKDKMPQTQFMVCSIHDDNETIFTPGGGMVAVTGLFGLRCHYSPYYR